MGNDFVVMIHCLAYLAVHREARFSSQQLASNGCSNPVIIRRLMSVAAAKRYVSVVNGAGGGYQIQVDPAEIRLGDLFILVGENQRLQKQFKDSVDVVCLVANNMNAVMNDLQQQQIMAQVSFYQKWTIADIVANLQEKAESKKIGGNKMEFIHEEQAFRHYNQTGEMDAEITYQVDGDVFIADHTYVDPALRGQKIGKKLVDKLADFARQNRKKIHPTCPYVVELFNKSSEYTDVKI